MAGRSSKCDVLGKKIPTNPKYKNMKPTVDTGTSVTKYMEKIEEIKKNYRIQKDEIFKRMKVCTFVQLVMQVAEVDAYEGTELSDDADAPDEVDTQRSAFDRLTNGEGEIREQENQPQAGPAFNSPFLILDVRDRDEYDKCHIITAQSFPHTLLSRGDNYQTKEMLACRNKDGTIIVVYDEDERMAPRVASVLVQRGYDNLFLLSGGLRLAKKLFPEGLVTGSGLEQGDGQPKEHFDEEDVSCLTVYLNNALDSMSGSSRLSTARSTTSRGSSARSSKAPFR